MSRRARANLPESINRGEENEKNYCTTSGEFDGEKAPRDDFSRCCCGHLHYAFQASGPRQRSSKPCRLQSRCGSEKIDGLENRNRRVRDSCRERAGDKITAVLDAICDAGRGCWMVLVWGEIEDGRRLEKFDLTKQTRERRRLTATLGKDPLLAQSTPDNGAK